MSGLIVGLVHKLPVTKRFTSELKFTASIYAEHAWEDGTHAYPAVQTVAEITGYHERSVQRYQRELVALGILIPDGKGPRGTNNYKFPLVEVDHAWKLDVNAGGDTQSPRQEATGDTDSGDTDSGDTSVTRINQPSLFLVVISAAEIFTAYEREIGVITPMIADAINCWLDVEKIPADWILEAMQIAVKANVRNWKYVEGILKNCKAKNVRPSLNKLEAKNANRTVNSKRAEKAVVTGDSDEAA